MPNSWYRVWRGRGAAGRAGADGADGAEAGQAGVRRTTVLLAVAGLVVVALVVTIVATSSAGGTGPGSRASAVTGADARSRAVSVTTGPAGTVDLEGVPGQLTIVGSSTGQIRLTGQLNWSGHAPYASVRTDRAARPASDRTLHLDYVCAAGSPCTQDYRLSVPAGTAVVLSQPSGHVIISGLAGALHIIAASVDVSATGLRSPVLDASITSGHVAAAFARAPRQLSVALTSAQATVRLPGASPGYQVSQQVASGYVHVGVAQAASSPYQVHAQITSGELELLSSG